MLLSEVDSGVRFGSTVRAIVLQGMHMRYLRFHMKLVVVNLMRSAHQMI